MSVDAAYQALSEEAASLYRLLGALPTRRHSTGSAAAAAALPAPQADRLLGLLVDAKLLTCTDADTYQFHRLIRLHAHQAARDPAAAEECAAAASRATRWYLATATEAATTVRPHRRARPAPTSDLSAEPLRFEDHLAALDWLDAQARDILALARHAAQHQDTGTALRLTQEMWTLFAYRKRYDVWQELDTLGLVCARSLRDRAGEAGMLRRLGLLATDLGRYDDALAQLNQALELFQGLGDRHRVATVLNSIGVLHLRRGDPATAIDLLHQAREIHGQLREARETALVLTDLGDALTDADRPHDAILHLTAAAEQPGESPDAYSRAHLHAVLGRAYAHTGQPSDAIRHLSAALHSMRATGSLTGQAEVMGYFGELAERAGDEALARERYDQVARLLVEAGAPGGWLWQRISALSPLARRALGTGPGGPAPHSGGVPRRDAHQQGQPMTADGGEL